MLPTGKTLPEALEERGIGRRDFIKFAGAMAATLALPPRYVTRIVEALERTPKPVLVWLEFQDCAGCSESILRSSHPGVDEIVLELLSWEYHELIMAGAGKQAEAQLKKVVQEQKGKYIAVVEGSIPMAENGVYCTIGGRTALDIATEVCSSAAATISMGACAWDGGWPAEGPTRAVGVDKAVPGIPVLNLGGCPPNAANTAAVITHYLTFGEMPATDKYNRPLFAYGHLIHEQCERRGFYDAGLFVEEWGDEGSRKGWCLYKMGCKGPSATYNCPVVRWNQGTSWPVQAGHGCIGCASYQFWSQNSPFYERLPSVPGFGADTSAEDIGLKLVAAVGALTMLHALAKAAQAAAPRLRKAVAAATAGKATDDEPDAGEEEPRA